jgi:hypothetical protein
MDRFIFRVESDNQGGMGHFYRCLALANILDGYQRAFLMNEYQPHLASILNTSNIKLETLNSKSPFIANADELSTYIDKKDIVILDGYHYDKSYMVVLKNIAEGPGSNSGFIGLVLPKYRAIDIDTSDDWKFAEALYMGLIIQKTKSSD